MKTKSKTSSVITVCICAAVLLAFTIWAWLKPAGDYSDSERRKLEQFPTLSLQTLLSGSFSGDFEDYTLDQFPLRDTFRTLKSISQFYLFMQKDNNKIYIEDGYASKLDFPLNIQSVTNATNRFKYLYDKYIAGTDAKVHAVIIPDKNYFLAEENGYPSIDYEALFSLVKDNMTYAEFTDIIDLLDISDYYYTDTHWRQENIEDVANRIAVALGITVETGSGYKVNATDVPFYGVYYGQSALPLKSETIYYLTNDILDKCTTEDVYGEVSGIYNSDKLHGKDPYEMFLSGNTPLLTIKNPENESGKKLIVFRDSFGSSLIPLLCGGYSEVVLIDIRYISSDLIGNFVDFNGSDVLFMYSTLLYNDSFSFK